MQLGKGDAASAQRLTDTGGERQGGELGHPVHTNLHTNLLHLHTRAHEARPPQAGSDRCLSKRMMSSATATKQRAPRPPPLRARAAALGDVEQLLHAPPLAVVDRAAAPPHALSMRME